MYKIINFSKSSRNYVKLAVLLIVFLSVSLYSQPVMAKYSGGGGTIIDPYRIRTAADWQTLMQSVSDWNKYFILTADIDLQNITLTPVGNSYPSTVFFGILDGQGHVISNAKITTPYSDNVGLFGNLGINGQIRNLNLINVTVSGRSKVGALAGYNWGGNVINCRSTGTINGTVSSGGLVGENFQGTIVQCSSACTVTDVNNAGGLVGYNNTGTITQSYSAGNVSGSISTGGLAGQNLSGNVTQCYSTGIVHGSFNTGGLVGNNNGNVAQCYSTSTVTGNYFAGALIGYNWEGTVTQCYSSGAVTGDYDIGGLAGLNNGTITKCSSTGTTSGNLSVGGLIGENLQGIAAECFSTNSVSGEDNVGGLVGYNNDDVVLCYSRSTVTGEDYVGGFAGRNAGDINDCYSTGSVSGSKNYTGGFLGENKGTLIRCYSTGSVDGKFDVGGLAGSNAGDIINSIWDMETSGMSGSSGGVGLNTEQMMDKEMPGLNGFAGDPNWILNSGHDYPRLAWEGTLGTMIPLPVIQLDGAGTTQSPYQIKNAEQLVLLGKSSIIWNKNFVLKTNIRLDPNFVDTDLVAPNLTNKLVFGQAIIPDFQGVFDGNDYIISNLIVKGGSYLGVFGRLEPEALIKNLVIQDVNIIGSGRYIGSLNGFNNGAVIVNCSGTGTISGHSWVGGLIGYNMAGSITQSYSSMGTVSGNLSTGGLLGENNKGAVTQSYSTNSVSGRFDTGGLVGYNLSGSITQCYSTGAVSGVLAAGGLAGDNNKGTITQCYSTGSVTGDYYIGGLAGNSDGTALASQSFWDMQTSGETSSAGGTGKTTSQMKIQSTFTGAGWDFMGEILNGTEDIWWMLDGQSYPRLWWELN